MFSGSLVKSYNLFHALFCFLLCFWASELFLLFLCRALYLPLEMEFLPAYTKREKEGGRMEKKKKKWCWKWCLSALESFASDLFYLPREEEKEKGGEEYPQN